MVLDWKKIEYSGVHIARHDGWEYRVAANVFHSPPGYSVCRYRIGQHMSEGEWFRGRHGHEDRVDLETGKQICEEVAQKGTTPPEPPLRFGPVQQEWVLKIPLMQQSVLFAAIRGPDGVRKTHPVKSLMRYFRRCILLSAFDQKALLDPLEPGGGSFTGPFTYQDAMAAFPEHGRELLRKDNAVPLRQWFDWTRQKYLEYVDELPHHFQLHFMHAAQIVGCHHDDDSAREFWRGFYLLLVDDAHLRPESDRDMNLRLSDDSAAWKAREAAPKLAEGVDD